jgi:hypothetical protein
MWASGAVDNDTVAQLGWAALAAGARSPSWQRGQRSRSSQ